MFENASQETKIKQDLRQETMKSALEGGCECPTCGQFVKVYKRKITSTMAKQLIRAWKKFGTEWFHITDESIGYGHGDFAKLRYWGMIESMPHEEGVDGKKTSGFWRVTNRGELFVNSKIQVNQYSFIYNGSKIDQGGKNVYIASCFKQHFDYNELMNE